jgi:putative ABC transport system permease protein
MWRDIRQAIRSLLADRTFSVLVVGTLSLAIGINTTIFSALNTVVLRPLDYDQPERLVMMWEENAGLGVEQELVSAATYLDWRERSRSFSSIAAYRHGGFTLMREDGAARIRSVTVSPALFSVLGASAALGRVFVPDEEQPGNERLIVLSHGSWQRRFGGDRSIVGSSIVLDSEAHVVVGVMPEGFEFPAGEDIEMWSPLTLSLEDLPSRPHRLYNTIGRLTQGTTLSSAKREMKEIAGSIALENPESNMGWGVTLMSAHEYVVGSLSGTLWFLFGAVGLVLLIGCVNVTSLLLARSTKSTRDLAVRAAFGAGAWALVRRTLAESIVLATTSGLGGLLLAWWGTGLMRGLIPDTVPRAEEIGIDGLVLAFTAGILIATGIISGVVPTLKALRPDVTGILKEGGLGNVSGKRGRWLTSSLVVVEVALAAMILIGAGLMIRSYVRLTDVNPGFRARDVVSVAVALPETRYGFDEYAPFYGSLLESVRAAPAYATSGAVSTLPMSPVGNDFEITFTVQGLAATSPSERPRAGYRAASQGYFRAMGIQLLRGRDFNVLDSQGGVDVVIINETLRERFFPDIDPIGEFLLGMPMLGELEIVGVVGDVLHSGLGSQPLPEVFVPYTQLPLSEMHVVVRTDLPVADVANYVRRKVAEIDTQVPISAVAAVEDLVSNSIAQPRFNMALLAGLALSAIFLAAVGIYGMVSYSVAGRTAEIGLRLAMGGDSTSIATMVLGEVSRLVALGLVLGVLGSAAFGRLFQTLLYGVESTDALTYITVATGLLGVGFLAGLPPAIRAMRIHPVTALRG